MGYWECAESCTVQFSSRMTKKENDPEKHSRRRLLSLVWLAVSLVVVVVVHTPCEA